MTAIRLPSWAEILAPETPWGLVLRSGGGGLWLLRGTAEEVEDLDARVVAATACRTSRELFSEWATALELEEPKEWRGFAEAVAVPARRAQAVLVADAERLLEDEFGRLPTLLESLRRAAERLAAGGRTLRVVFQSRFDERPERLAVFHEFGAAEIG